MSVTRFLSSSLLAAALVEGLSVPRGEALYQGKELLRGRIRGHDDRLPPETVRCANCHSASTGTRLSGIPAPRLTPEWLLQMRSRRGGPPSQYSRASFCKLLSQGVDPSYILIAREMPIYELDAAQCDSLWAFLSKNQDIHESH